MGDVAERLRRKEIGRTMFGGVAAGAFHHKYVNPDGPKAADEIEALGAGYTDLMDLLEHMITEPEFSESQKIALSNYIYLKFPDWGPDALRARAALKGGDA